MEPREFAAALLELFGENGERWGTGAYARDEHGYAINHLDPRATCWCLVGAAARIMDYLEPDDLALDLEFVELVAAILPDAELVDSWRGLRLVNQEGNGLAADSEASEWNDASTWTEVRDALSQVAS